MAIARIVDVESITLYKLTDTCRRVKEIQRERPLRPMTDDEEDDWVAIVDGALDECERVVAEFDRCAERIASLGLRGLWSRFPAPNCRCTLLAVHETYEHGAGI